VKPNTPLATVGAPENAKALMSQEEIDGALVGGASLDAKSFAAIVTSSAVQS